MKTFSNEDSIYIGKEAGKEILHRIKNAKSSVKVVSPYLSASYVQELISLHKQGRKITLITSDNIVTERSPYTNFRTGDLVNKEKVNNIKTDKTRKTCLKLFIFTIIGSLILLALSSFLAYGFLHILTGIVFVSSLILILLWWIIEPHSYKYTPIFRIKVFDSRSGKNPQSTELIHSKIFVIDDELAFLGSANFTYSGFKKHYETVIEVKDKKAVKSISQEVEDLYNSNIARAKDPKEWAS